jgi:hypothetical protein
MHTHTCTQKKLLDALLEETYSITELKESPYSIRNMYKWVKAQDLLSCPSDVCDVFRCGFLRKSCTLMLDAVSFRSHTPVFLENQTVALESHAP